MSILQDYLDRETERAQPLIQGTLDSYGSLLELIADSPNSPDTVNLLQCGQLLYEISDSISPTPDFDGKVKLTLEQIEVWRDKLSVAFGSVGIARMLFAAHILSLPEYAWPSES